MKAAVYIIIFVPVLVLAQPPYEPISIWEREGACDTTFYGEAILALGDQNDDGFNDWAVFAAGWGPPGQPCEPRVEFFHGGNPPSAVPYMVRLTETPEEEYIWDARTVGDLNNDGYVDWAIKVQLSERNVQKIYFGGLGPHNEPDLEFTAASVRTVGDFNGDDYDDLWCSVTWDYSEAFIYGGNPMDTLPDWLRSTDLGSVRAGNLNGDSFADFVSYESQTFVDIYLGEVAPDTVPFYHWPITTSWRFVVRDVNNDGFDELCYTRPDRINVHYGSTEMQSEPSAWLDFPCSGGLRRVASAGDFNDDGFNDVVTFSDWCNDSWYGTLTLHLGAAWLNPVPAFIIYGWTPPLNLIHFKSATALGDVNGDGWDDLGIGANGTPEQAAHRGKAIVLSGDTSLHVAADEPYNPLPNALEVIAYPNPFNQSTTVSVQLPPYHDEVQLAVYNLLGQQVKTITINNLPSWVRYTLEASDFPTGLYLLRVSSGDLQTTTKLMVLK